ncbi:MAG: MXAN_5187 C-terminal domain-containing protein [Myxococcales bacterium]|jgi:hypothetical protein
MAGPTKTDNVRSAVPPDQEAVAQEATELDGEIAALRARFDQYFLGIDKHNPAKDCEALKKRILKLKGQFIRNTGLKFRVESLYAKFQSYERLWMKSLKEIEEGTYRRDLMRLRRKNQRSTAKPKPAEAPEKAKEEEKPRPDFYTLDEDLEADLPDDLFEDPVPAKKPPVVPPQVASAPAPKPPPAPPAARPPPASTPKAAPPMRGAAAVPTASAPPPIPRAATGSPAARAVPPQPPAQAMASKPLPRTTTGSIPIPVAPSARTPPPPPKGAGTGDMGLSSEKLNRLYSAYIMAKKRCKESTTGITPEAVAQSLRKQVPRIMQESGAKAVDFKVVIKDGKAILKAVPK